MLKGRFHAVGRMVNLDGRRSSIFDVDLSHSERKIAVEGKRQARWIRRD
jgi:hypothetical protein